MPGTPAPGTPAPSANLPGPSRSGNRWDKLRKVANARQNWAQQTEKVQADLSNILEFIANTRKKVLADMRLKVRE